MLTFYKNSDTLIVVLHEIYGINEHITEVCRDLSDAGFDVICPDLLDGKPCFDYAREEEAHRYFMNYIGFESAARKVTFLLRQEEGNYKRIFLLGYSIGATVAWLCGAVSGKTEESFHYGGSLIKCTGLICYYGSRIRDYTEVSLICPAILFYPEEEAAFRPLDLQRVLEKTDQAEVHIFDGRHGFADPFSSNYNEGSCLGAKRLAQKFIERTL